MLIDSHCHLADSAFDADREAVVERARAAGVGWMVVVADGPDTALAARHLARAHQGCVSTAGLHPHRASECDATVRAGIEAAVREPEVVAVGETGLDYHYDHSPREAQIESFAWQLALAAEVGKPVIVHAREADTDTARLLARAPSGLTGVMHSFSSGAELLDAALERGLCVSFSGMVTFAKWDGAWAVERVPDDRLLVETDAPYLAPAPHRGKRSEPAFVAATAARIAELRGTSAERIAELTTANALRLFRLADSTPITHHPSPITPHPSPITHHPSPITHHPSPITSHP